MGPFNYDVIMRAGGRARHPDGTPDTLSFVGNFPPCVQCIELGRLDLAPDVAYEDIVADNCYDSGCLDTQTDLELYVNFGVPQPDYDPTNPLHLDWRQPGGIGSVPSGSIWVNAAAGTVTLTEPSGTGWFRIFTQEYAMVVYLHGKDNPKEHWAPGLAHQRIKAWRYQIDYEQDPGNALADGGGRDNLDLLTGFNVDQNNPIPTRA